MPQHATLDSVPGYIFTRTGTQGSIDASGAVQWFGPNVPAIDSAGYHAYGALTNYLLNAGSDTVLVTQSYTTTATAYTLAFIGTGSIALSGAYTETLAGTGASNQVVLNFTSTAASLTLTVTGDVRYAVLLGGTLGAPVPVIATTTAPASIGASNLKVAASIPAGDYIAWAVVKLPGRPSASVTAFYYVENSNPTANRVFPFLDTSGNWRFSNLTANGVEQPKPAYSLSAMPVSGGRAILLVRCRNGIYSLAAKTPNGTILLGTESSGVSAVPAVNTIHIGAAYNASLALNGKIEGIFQRNGTFYDAEITSILEAA